MARKRGGRDSVVYVDSSSSPSFLPRTYLSPLFRWSFGRSIYSVRLYAVVEISINTFFLVLG